MKAFPNKRKEKQKTMQELLRSKSIKSLIKKEKRKDELTKLKEVQLQDKTYYCTLFACAGMVFVLCCLALFGGYQ